MIKEDMDLTERYCLVLHPNDEVIIRRHIDIKTETLKLLTNLNDGLYEAMVALMGEDSLKKMLFNQIMGEVELSKEEREELNNSYFIMHSEGFISSPLKIIIETFHEEELISKLGLHLVKTPEDPLTFLPYLADVDDKEGLKTIVREGGKIQKGMFGKKYDIKLDDKGNYISAIRIKKEFIEKFV